MESNRNIKFGQVFHELRTKTNTKYADLKSIISSSALSSFEEGKTIPKYDKIADMLEIMDFTISDFFYLTNPKLHFINKYGHVFHDIRFQHGYREDFFTNLHVPIYRLQLFETGKIMLPYNTIDEMLQAMHVPENDYIYWINDGIEDYFLEIFRAIDFAYYSDNDLLLANIESEAHEAAKRISPEEFSIEEEIDYANLQVNQATKQYTDFLLIELSAAARRHSLSEIQSNAIADFLAGIETWTEVTLSMLACTIDSLDSGSIIEAFEQIFNKKAELKSNLNYCRLLILASMRAVIALVDQKKFQMAQSLLSHSKFFLQYSDIYSHALFKFAEGYLQYKQYASEKGENLMRQTISSLEFLDAKTVASKFLQIYERALAQSE